MKLTIISDTHNRHEELSCKKGEILIHCGDLTDIFSKKNPAQQLIELNEWFGTLKYDKIICVAGNHDYILQQIPEARKFITNAVYLEDEVFEHDGIKFYGSPWQLTCGNLGFNAEEYQLDSIWAKIPQDTDVLITHSPPFDILDKTKHGDRIGSTSLAFKVKQVKPKVHCFVHCHWGRGKKKIDGTTYINASTALNYDQLLGSFQIDV